jgi:hypothetical protein
MDPVTEERIKFTNRMVDKYREEFRKYAEKGEGDPEALHSDGDMLLCNLLVELGYADVVSLWAKLPKWYA